MSDVARLAGVSAMTVSRALRRDAPVGEATRERILAAAAKLDYVLDSTAAGLSSGRTGFIACTIPSINNANFADTVRGLTDGVAEHGLQVLLGYSNYDKEVEERLLAQLQRRRPEGIVVTGGAHTDRCRALLARGTIPVVEMWDLPADPVGDVVGFSNADAARLVVEHLFDEGYRRLGFIGGDTSRDSRGLDRRRGFVRAVDALGLDASRVVGVGTPPITMRDGAAGLAELCQRWPDVEAVMCVSDLAAFGAMTECQRLGRRVPDDLAVAGFGAYDIAEFALPPITTVDVQAYRIGSLVASRLANALGESPRAPSQVTRIEPRLLLRASTRAAGRVAVS